MDNDLYTLLSNNKIFSSLSHRILKKILPKFEKFELTQDEILYYQGDPSDSVEILLSGKLIAILTTVTGENNPVGEIQPGETVGELGALSNQARAVTVKALQNSVLAKLPTDIFLELCREYPAILLEVINPIVSRSQQIMQIFTAERFRKNIVFLNINEGIKIDVFYQQLQKNINQVDNVVILSDLEERFQQDNIHEIVDEIKKQYSKKAKSQILFLLNSHSSLLASYCLNKCDMIYLVASSSSPPLIDDTVLKKLDHFKMVKKIKPELILMHPPQVKLPIGTIQWLNMTEFNLHHHVKINRDSDFRRLVRFIRGKAVGLVLGGGGTRGWGQVGAIKALIEAGIPIDAVGGTSVGAIVAGTYASTLNYQETHQLFEILIEHTRHSVSWRSLTWPAISLFSGKKLTGALQKVFKKIQIEDLWLPYFCVTTNLTTNSEIVHTRGNLWEKVRGSTSIPGIVPPVVIDGQLHFDGGLLNNLPVDIMRKIITHRGTIIAVELSGTTLDTHRYRFPPVLPFWQTFLAKIGFGYDYRFPRFVDTFLKALNAGSSLKTQQNSLAANLVINLELSHYPMLYSHKKHEKKIVEIGYEATLNQIKNMKKL